MVINKYIHSYKFNYSSFLQNYISEIIDKYSTRNVHDDFDLVLENKEIENYIFPKLNKIVEDNYHVGKNYGETRISVYVQEPSNEEPKEEFFHNHVHTCGSINGVFYLNIPKEGGGIQFFNPPWVDLTIQPQIDTLYLFPYWIMHRPLPHKEDIIRISFNWTYGGIERPIYKLTGELW